MGKITAPTLITEKHDASLFSCEHESLSAWLKEKGLKNSLSGSSKTYVVCTEDGLSVIGYYALAAGAIINPAEAPGKIRRNSPTPIPVIVLGRLAVHSQYEGKGIGKGLLKEAILRSKEAANLVGAKAILCHAIDEKAKAFYLKHGFVESPIQPLTVMLSLLT